MVTQKRTPRAKSNRLAVRWRATVSDGMCANPFAQSSVLSELDGEIDVESTNPLPSGDGERCLLAMLMTLETYAKKLQPLDPTAWPTRSMVVRVQQLSGRSRLMSAPMARLNIQLDDACARASAMVSGASDRDCGPLEYGEDDLVWEIVLKVLRPLVSAQTRTRT